MARRSNRWDKEKKKSPDMFPKSRHQIDTRQEPEEDEQQIEALMVEVGRSKLMFED